MGRSEKGRAEIDTRDFPSEPEKQTEEVKSQLGGEKSSGEAADEVP